MITQDWRKNCEDWSRKTKCTKNQIKNLISKLRSSKASFMDYKHLWSRYRFRCLWVYKALLSLKSLASNIKLKNLDFKTQHHFPTTQIGIWTSPVRPKTSQRSVVSKGSMSRQITHSLLQSNNKLHSLVTLNWMVYFHHLGLLVHNWWKNKQLTAIKENRTRFKHLNTFCQIVTHPICQTLVSSNSNRHYSVVNLKTILPNRT